MSPLRYIVFIMLFAMTACSGYSLGEGNSNVLAPEYRLLAIDEVSNPTTLSWMEPRIRKFLRDELNNRRTISWTDDRRRADALITITVNRYNRPTAVAGENDTTLRSSADFQFEAVIRSATTGKELWRSGTISQNWPFFTGDEEAADKEVVRLGIRRLADRMTQNY